MAFLLLLAQTPPQLCGVPEDGSLPPQYKSLNPWSIGSRADLIDKILCLFVLSYLGAAWDTEARSLICLTWTSLRVENWPALLSDTVRWWTTHSHLGLKILAEMQQTAQRLGRKARENFFFEKPELGKASTYIWEFRNPNICPRKVRCSEKTIECSKLLPLADLYSQCKQEVKSNSEL